MAAVPFYGGDAILIYMRILQYSLQAIPKNITLRNNTCAVPWQNEVAVSSTSTSRGTVDSKKVILYCMSYANFIGVIQP